MTLKLSEVKEFFKPTIYKIIIFVALYVLQFIIFGFPVEHTTECIFGNCPNMTGFYTIQAIIENYNSITSGTLLLWYIYVIEAAVSYTISCTIIYFYNKKQIFKLTVF